MVQGKGWGVLVAQERSHGLSYFARHTGSGLIVAPSAILGDIHLTLAETTVGRKFYKNKVNLLADILIDHCSGESEQESRERRLRFLIVCGFLKRTFMHPSVLERHNSSTFPFELNEVFCRRIFRTTPALLLIHSSSPQPLHGCWIAVSKKHCVITYACDVGPPDDYVVTLVDHSRKGLFVNEQRIFGGPCQLKHGDIVNFHPDDTEYEFRIVGVNGKPSNPSPSKPDATSTQGEHKRAADEDEEPAAKRFKSCGSEGDGIEAVDEAEQGAQAVGKEPGEAARKAPAATPSPVTANAAVAAGHANALAESPAATAVTKSATAANTAAAAATALPDGTETFHLAATTSPASPTFHIPLASTSADAIEYAGGAAVASAVLDDATVSAAVAAATIQEGTEISAAAEGAGAARAIMEAEAQILQDDATANRGAVQRTVEVEMVTRDAATFIYTSLDDTISKASIRKRPQSLMGLAKQLSPVEFNDNDVDPPRASPLERIPGRAAVSHWALGTLPVKRVVPAEVAAEIARRGPWSKRLVDDPCKEMEVVKQKMLSGASSWTKGEKLIFHKKYTTYGKGFAKIAQYLPGRTTADCVRFYYMVKKKSDVLTGKTAHADCGRRLKVWWKHEGQFFRGTVKAVDMHKWGGMGHYVLYDDGDENWINVAKDQVRWYRERVFEPSDVDAEEDALGDRSINASLHRPRADVRTVANPLMGNLAPNISVEDTLDRHGGHICVSAYDHETNAGGCHDSDNNHDGAGREGGRSGGEGGGGGEGTGSRAGDRAQTSGGGPAATAEGGEGSGGAGGEEGDRAGTGDGARGEVESTTAIMLQRLVVESLLETGREKQSGGELHLEARGGGQL